MVTGSSTAGLGVGMVGLRSPLLLPKASFHLDGFLVMAGVGGTMSLAPRKMRSQAHCSDSMNRCGLERSMYTSHQDDLQRHLGSLDDACGELGEAW